jgi:hypothetical protein
MQGCAARSRIVATEPGYFGIGSPSRGVSRSPVRDSVDFLKIAWSTC